MTKHPLDPPNRTGTTIAELLVAATLLTAGIAFIAQGLVQTKRLMQDMRHFYLALDELGNQLESLTSMASGEREAAIVNLQPSQAIQSSLDNVLLKAIELNDEDGTRIQLSIQWDRHGPATPINLVGWVQPKAPNASIELSVAEQRKASGEAVANTKEPDGWRRTATRSSP